MAWSTQSLVFRQDLGWDVASAKAWAKDHGYRYGKVDEKPNTIRLRQFDPPSGSVPYATIPFGQSGISAVRVDLGADLGVFGEIGTVDSFSGLDFDYGLTDDPNDGFEWRPWGTIDSTEMFQVMPWDDPPGDGPRGDDYPGFYGTLNEGACACSGTTTPQVMGEEFGARSPVPGISKWTVEPDLYKEFAPTGETRKSYSYVLGDRSKPDYIRYEVIPLASPPGYGLHVSHLDSQGRHVMHYIGPDGGRALPSTRFAHPEYAAAAAQRHALSPALAHRRAGFGETVIIERGGSPLGALLTIAAVSAALVAGTYYGVKKIGRWADRQGI